MKKDRVFVRISCTGHDGAAQITTTHSVLNKQSLSEVIDGVGE